MRLASEPRWWELHSNLVILLQWMIDRDAYNKADMAEAIRKPWFYNAEARSALIEGVPADDYAAE